jgi:hypothetical protein
VELAKNESVLAPLLDIRYSLVYRVKTLYVDTSGGFMESSDALLHHKPMIRGSIGIIAWQTRPNAK